MSLLSQFLAINPAVNSERDAQLFARLSLLAYGDPWEIEAQAFEWGFDAQFFEVGSTQAVILSNDSLVVLAFPGTASIEDVLTDLKIRRKNHEHFGAVHRGFLDAFQSIWSVLKEPLTEAAFKKDLVLCGHSLGGALATLAAAEIVWRGPKIPAAVYTFGSPRVGNCHFADTLGRFMKGRWRRYENSVDAVPRVPFFLWGYCHVGDRYYLDVDGAVHKNPGWWFVIKDRIKGRWRDLGRLGTKGGKDHLLSNYIDALRV